LIISIKMIAIGVAIGVTISLFAGSLLFTPDMVSLTDDRQVIQIEQVVSDFQGGTQFMINDMVSQVTFIRDTLKDVQFISGVKFVSGNIINDTNNVIQVGRAINLTVTEVTPVCTFIVPENQTGVVLQNQTIINLLLENRYDYELIPNRNCEIEGVIIALLGWEIIS